MFRRRFRPFGGRRHSWHAEEHWSAEGGHPGHAGHGGPEGPRHWKEHHGHGRGGEGFRFAPGGGWDWGGGPPEDDGDSFGRGGRGRGRQRARRGDLKLVLLGLVAEKPRHGYELIKELEQRYAGFYRPSPGSVYPTLQFMEDEGHLTSVVEQGKRIYTITEAGQQWLGEQGRDSATHMGGRRGGRGHEERSALRQRMMALMGSIQQVARHGTSEQIQGVLAALDTATRQIYAILAGGRPDGAREDGDR